MKRLTGIAILMVIFGWTGFAEAARMYVSDVIKITLRRGPGISHKVIGEPSSGQPLEALDTQGNWTYVRLPDGKTGWVLSRFLTTQKPKEVLLEALRKDHAALTERAGTLESENEKLKTENAELRQQVEDFRKSLDEVTASYETLKSESREFLTLKRKYDAAVSELSTHENQTDHLSQKLAKLEWKQNLIMWSGGAMVFFLGFIFGGIRGGERRGRF